MAGFARPKQLHVETEPLATGSSEATTEHAELTELQINRLVPDLCPVRSLWFLSGAQATWYLGHAPWSLQAVMKNGERIPLGVNERVKERVEYLA